MRLVGAVVACAGCLSEPAFPQAEGQPFPPAGPIAVQSAAVADLNGDGAPDLLLGSDPGPDDRGLYLLFGGGTGWYARFHGRLPTPEVSPYAAHAQDLDRDQLADVVVLGPTGVEQARLAAYLGVGPGGTDFGPGMIRDIGDGAQVSAGDRRGYVVPARLDDDDDVDLILGQFRWEAAVEIDRFGDPFIDVPLASIPRDLAQGDSTAAATPVRDAASGLDDLLIARFDSSVYHANANGVSFPDTGTLMPYNDVVAHDLAGFFDLDGDQQPDILGFGAGRMSGVVTRLTSPALYRFAEYYEGTPTFLHVADLDGDGAPEMVVVQTTATGTQVLLFAAIRIDDQVDPPVLVTQVRPAVDLADFEVAAAAAADFDDDGAVEAILVAADGEIRCLQLRSPGLAGCP